MTRVFCDFHHGALGRFMAYLFADRLGLDFYFPSTECSVGTGAAQDGTWGCPNPQSLLNIGLTPDEARKVKLATLAEFQYLPWDICVLTRPESVRIFRQNRHPMKDTLYVGVSGNEGTRYDWSWIHHLIATDLMSYQINAKKAKTLHIPQELGRYFDRGEFVPIETENLNHIGSFTHNLKGYDAPIQPRCCPAPVNIFQIWQGMKAALPAHRFSPYGHSNDSIGGESIMDSRLADYYYHIALNWNFKTYEGFGHSLLQSLPAGRLPICPAKFYDDRTAGKYLIDNVTCLFVDYTVESCVEKIRWFTSDLNRANDMSRACYEKQKTLFDFAGDALKVKEFLGL